jgi:hypothetical protein
MTAIVFQMGVMASLTPFKSRTLRLLNMESGASNSFRSTWALAQDMGNEGIEGMLTASVRFALGYDGAPGVVGSPTDWY